MTKNRKTALNSRKVYLRRLQESDYEGLRERFSSSAKLFRGFASSRFDREKFDEMLRSARLESNEAFLICTHPNHAIVGLINLSQIFRKSFQNAYLGYQLFEGFTGFGYMTEAVDLTLRFAFEELGLHRVGANVQPGNKPSIGVLKRNGFTKEGFSRRYLKIGGRWRDHERWAAIKEDWKRQKRK